MVAWDFVEWFGCGVAHVMAFVIDVATRTLEIYANLVKCGHEHLN